MNFKDKLKERIEKNAVKIPNITWFEKDGTPHTEDIVLKRSRFPLTGDWNRVYPPLNEDGSINWINTIFGGSKNFIRTLILLGIVGLFFLGYYDVFNSYEALKKVCDPLLNRIIP